MHNIRGIMAVYNNEDENFEKAFKYILKAEGGYICDKNDRGGATNLGITQNTYNTFRQRKKLAPHSVSLLTKDEAKQIYYENYWCLSGADRISDFAAALVLFDSCVNHGVSAGKALYKNSGGNVELFLKLRRNKYENIVKRCPSQKVFYKGWMNRIKRLEEYIKTI